MSLHASVSLRLPVKEEEKRPLESFLSMLSGQDVILQSAQIARANESPDSIFIFVWDQDSAPDMLVGFACLLLCHSPWRSFGILSDVSVLREDCKIIESIAEAAFCFAQSNGLDSVQFQLPSTSRSVIESFEYFCRSRSFSLTHEGTLSFRVPKN